MGHCRTAGDSGSLGIEEPKDDYNNEGGTCTSRIRHKVYRRRTTRVMS